MVSADVQLLVLFTHQFFNLNREHGWWTPWRRKLVEATAVFVSEHLWPQCDSVSCRPELNVLTFNSVAEPKILFKALSCCRLLSTNRIWCWRSVWWRWFAPLTAQLLFSVKKKQLSLPKCWFFSSSKSCCVLYFQCFEEWSGSQSSFVSDVTKFIVLGLVSQKGFARSSCTQTNNRQVLDQYTSPTGLLCALVWHLS